MDPVPLSLPYTPALFACPLLVRPKTPLFRPVVAKLIPVRAVPFGVEMKDEMGYPRENPCGVEVPDE